MTPIPLLDLFAGIGGFSLGLERSGVFKTVAFCEIDPFCRQVLKNNWPEVHCYEDVTTLTGEQLRRDGIEVGAICGGFPCQDVSEAGKQKGIKGSRSGLWSEFARLIDEIRPRYAIVENVTGLLSRGADRVLGDLASIGYDAEWDCIPAAAVGAPHIRKRIFILAYPQGFRPNNAHALSDTGEGQKAPADREVRAFKYASGVVSKLEERGWPCEPRVHRVVNGFPDRIHRSRSLGNAIVPRVSEVIGRIIGECYE